MKTATSMRPLLAAAAGARAATRVPAAAGRRAASSLTTTAGRRITCGARRTTTAPLGVQGTRAFSAAPRRQEEAFDPATVERESDEVDVCIVGGGM
jgi:electron-transferring-flavoprotein dehydrogenase